MKLKTKTRNLLRNLILIVAIYSIALIPKIIGLGKGAFANSEVLQQYNIYTSFLLIPSIIIISLLLIEYFITKDEDKYGGSIFMNSQGETPSLKIFGRFTTMQLLILSFLFFSILGLVIYSVKQQAFTGVGVLKQQFTIFDSVIFSTFLVPVIENLDAIAVLAVSIFLLRWYARKVNLDVVSYRIFAFLLSLVVGTYGVINHQLRYSGSDIASFTVFVFWTLGGFLTILTGNFSVFWMQHVVNNLLFDLSRFLSSDVLRIYVGVFLVGVLALYVAIYRKRLFGKENNLKSKIEGIE